MPKELQPTLECLAQVIADSKTNGEEMTSELAKLWLEQHEAVNKYVYDFTRSIPEHPRKRRWSGREVYQA